LKPPAQIVEQAQHFANIATDRDPFALFAVS
jgi:hypothetical protein